MPSYQQTLDYIFNLRGGEIDLRLHRVERALALFGHPERRYPSFHIAGTNGKGSTAAILHRMLTAAGYRTALYISPHLVSFTERIRVSDREISEDEVVELAERVKAQTGEAGISLTFFEFVTVMALVYFAEHEVDVAVVEVGLGGRLDATNLVLPCVSVITTISKDHEAYLGSDLLSIAREKGGIVKDGVAVVCGSLRSDVQELLRGIAQAKGSASYFLGQSFAVSAGEHDLFDYAGLNRRLKGLSLGLRGAHQRQNAALALCALELAGGQFAVSESAVREGLKSVLWPGRLEVVRQQPLVILDGAHNGEGMRTLVQEIRGLVGSKRLTVLFAVMADKDWPLMLNELSTIASEIVLTRVSMERSADPRTLAGAVQGLPMTVSDDPRHAIRSILDRAAPGDAVLVTGSLYLLGEVRPVLVGPRG